MKVLFYNILFVMVISACNLIPGGMTPADAVRDTLPSPDFQIVLVRQFEEGTVVLYHNPHFMFIPGDPQNPVFQLGYSYVDRQGLRWRVRGGVSGSFTPKQGSKNIFLLDQVQSGALNPKTNKPDARAFIVFGKVLDPAIETVEMIDAEGEQMSDFISDSMFMMIESPGASPCELRFIGNNGEVIQAFDHTQWKEWQSSQDLMERINAACTE